jgi:hypothetical protein
MLKKTIVVCVAVAALAAAPSMAQGVLFVANNFVGIGQPNPDAPLHIEQDGGGSLIDMVKLVNNGAPQFRYVDTSNGITWRLGPNPSGDLVFNEIADLGVAELKITADGVVSVNGAQVHPDYVFEPEYELMSLAAVEDFIEENQHLPGVISAEAANGEINLSAFPLQLLEKVEELMLYTIDQEKGLERLEAENTMLRERLLALEAAVGQR